MRQSQAQSNSSKYPHYNRSSRMAVEETDHYPYGNQTQTKYQENSLFNNYRHGHAVTLEKNNGPRPVVKSNNTSQSMILIMIGLMRIFD